jgi:hypothetical protein
MNKLLQTFGLMVALATTSMLAGCELYFGSHDHKGGGGTWNYCGTDGYYQCHGDSCTWVSPTCPAPGSGSGYECTSSTDCAAGCYCASGSCQEGGFCATDSDCGPGYHCNTDRSSCEPNGGSGSGSNNSCSSDASCPEGQTCQDNSCTATCVCDTDASAVKQGFGYCDESRQTCMPGSDPSGTCAGTPPATCTTAEPQCKSGEVPLMDPTTGCFNGLCQAYGNCGDAPVCEHIDDEYNCLSRTTDCSASYTGLNCHKADGSACHSGDTGCTCQSFEFAKCTTKQ